MKFDFKRIGKKIIVGVLSTMLIVGVTAHESNALTKYIQLYGKTGTSLKTKESYLQAYTGQIYKANSSENDTIYQREIKPYNKKHDHEQENDGAGCGAAARKRYARERQGTNRQGVQPRGFLPGEGEGCLLESAAEPPFHGHASRMYRPD